MSIDIEDIAHKKVTNLSTRDIYRNCDESTCDTFIKEIISILNKSSSDFSKREWKALMTSMLRKHHISPGTVTMNYTYYKLLNNNECDESPLFEKYVVGKLCRTNSGITQITVLTSPYPNGQEFSCEHNCYYCPNEPAHEGNNFVAQPRSYLFNEPAVRRANSNKFDAAEQMWDRMSSLKLCGLKIDKLEVMVLGGTWGSYPEDYREEFIRDLYYAANTFYVDKDKRYCRMSLEDEIKCNMMSEVRIIGLTLETRPDHVTARELYLFRKYNCTRIQIGVQHTDKKILSKINRGCYTDDTIRAIRNLMDIGLKVDVHLMFDLPFATMEDDMTMIDTMYSNPHLMFDQVKFYPFSSMDWTVTKQWEDNGMNLHYTAEELIEVIVYAKSRIPPWVRINRVIRDIPTQYITDGNDVPNLRQTLHKIMKERNLTCDCIRCREVKNNKEALDNIDNAKLFIRKYDASFGKEYFISIESPDNKYIYGFCRLRLSPNMGYVTDIKPRIHRKTREDKIPKLINLFPNLNGYAMIRELHVYGNMNPVDSKLPHTQHRGFGKMLVRKAEHIAMMNGYFNMAIISGVGVRQYYQKLGYHLDNTYMVKNLFDKLIRVFILVIIIIAIIFIYF